jgi:hypothetical protein
MVVRSRFIGLCCGSVRPHNSTYDSSVTITNHMLYIACNCQDDSGLLKPILQIHGHGC